jgi:hypothetical protein
VARCEFTAAMRNYRPNAQLQIGMRKPLGFLSPQTPFGMTVFGQRGAYVVFSFLMGTDK